MNETKSSLGLFLFITFGLMYGAHAIVIILLNQEVLEFEHGLTQFLTILGGGAPAFAALFIVFRRYNEEEKKQYWQAVYRLNVAWHWWVFLVIAPLTIGVVTNLVYHQNLHRLTLSTGQLITLPMTFAIMIFAGGAEELGWRGIMQKQLHSKIKLPFIGLFIGLIWGVWHLPLFFIDHLAHADFNFFMYLLTTILFSLWMTAVVYKTKSVGLAILFHAMLNTIGHFGLGIPMVYSLGNTLVLGALIGLSILWLYTIEDTAKA